MMNDNEADGQRRAGWPVARFAAACAGITLAGIACGALAGILLHLAAAALARLALP